MTTWHLNNIMVLTIFFYCSRIALNLQHTCRNMGPCLWWSIKFSSNRDIILFGLWIDVPISQIMMFKLLHIHHITTISEMFNLKRSCHQYGVLDMFLLVFFIKFTSHRYSSFYIHCKFSPPFLCKYTSKLFLYNHLLPCISYYIISAIIVWGLRLCHAPQAEHGMTLKQDLII